MVPIQPLRFSTRLLPIAWILIGLMVGGSLFDYLATRHMSGICVELRFEQEDDRSDLSDLLFVPTHATSLLSSPRLAEELVEDPRLDIWTVQQAAHFERGPPSLALAIV